MRLPLLKPGVALPVLACACAAIVSAAGTPGLEAKQALPSARSIIDKHIKAIGGREAILAQTSMHSVGTVSLPGPDISGTLETFQGKPNKFLQRMTMPGIGPLEEGFDGTVGWSISPMTGPILLDGKQLEQRKFDVDFYEELKAPERYSAITTMEKTTFDGRAAYKIKLVKKDGDEDIEFYDADTGLKAGVTTSRETPMGTMQGTTVWTDFKQFGPLMHPATTKVTMMNVEMIMTIQSVEYGKVDPSVFTVPAQIKALIK
ncbi:MAG TPA: hypothetical protein VH740_25410 [Vicinamibacterales bacterium]|jgi:hypothetical protein